MVARSAFINNAEIVMFAKLHYMDYASLIFCMHIEESDNEYSLLASVRFVS